MITEQSIIDFLEKFNYDIRKSNNGRWIDQKCTPDVLSFIADCIYTYNNENPNKEFSSLDIWHSDYAVKNTETVFKKPNPKQTSAKNEYDKFFQQPMKLFANANVLIEKKVKGKNIYCINKLDILEYIALSERNSLRFLTRYIEKVLNDSNLMCIFSSFFNNQKNANGEQLKQLYSELKREFYSFTHSYTKITKNLECGRIFTKVLNPLAYKYSAYGTKDGHISKDIITYDVLMYNRNNFRDIYANKPKGITRKEYLKNHPIEINEKYYEYQSTKAKKFLRFFNDQYRNGITEHLEANNMNDIATNIHHIFPKSLYPEICYYLENLIALTPTQHFNYAHPNGNTQEINYEYQRLLLLSKSDRIKENIEESYNGKTEKIYEFSKFLEVLSIGFDNDEITSVDDMDFNSVVNAINVYYC